jgi:hypothetical protein
MADFETFSNVDPNGFYTGVSDPAPSVADAPETIRPPITSTRATGKYSVGIMSFPKDVTTNSLQNYIKFYINVQSDSKIARDNSEEMAAVQPDRSAMNSLVGKPTSSTAYTAAAAAQGAVLGFVGGLAAGASGAKDAVGAIGGAAGGAAKGAIGGALIGGGTAAVQTTVLESAGIKFGQPAKRLKEAIVLYTPQQLSVRYGMQWSEEDVGIAAALATNPELANQLKAAGDSMKAGNVKDGASTGASGITSAGKGIISSEILKGNSGLSAMSRSAGNPRKEQIFKGVDYRRFTFDYQFAPRDAAEAQAALNIIWLFKYHMHPEFKDANNFVYVYPSEFDIEYFINGQQNNNLNKISSCVLTEMNVNYSPNGVFTTFPDGTPTQINVTLNFVELETLTKERIEAGL